MNISKELKKRIIDYLEATKEVGSDEILAELTRKPGRPVGWRKRPRDEDKKVVDNVVNP